MGISFRLLRSLFCSRLEDCIPIVISIRRSFRITPTRELGRNPGAVRTRVWRQRSPARHLPARTRSGTLFPTIWCSRINSSGRSARRLQHGEWRPGLFPVLDLLPTLFLTVSGSARESSFVLRSNLLSTPVIVDQNRGYTEATCAAISPASTVIMTGRPVSIRSSRRFTKRWHTTLPIPRNSTPARKSISGSGAKVGH